MAKENTVHLYGQVVEDPVIKVRPTGEATSAHIILKCIRRPYLIGEGYVDAGNQRIDYIPVITMVADQIKQMSDMRKNDMVELKGVITTRNVRKAYICEHGHEFKYVGMRSYVTPIFMTVREKGAKVVETIPALPSRSERTIYSEGITPDTGMELLHKYSEISNQVYLIGTLVTDPLFYEFNDEKGGAMMQYQLASNRRYHLPDKHDDEHTDYPWVKTVNKQARTDRLHLKKGATIFINGAIQSRDIERDVTCEVCNCKVHVHERVFELYPYSVEYLANCVALKRDDSEGTIVGSLAAQLPRPEPEQPKHNESIVEKKEKASQSAQSEMATERADVGEVLSIADSEEDAARLLAEGLEDY